MKIHNRASDFRGWRLRLLVVLMCVGFLSTGCRSSRPLVSIPFSEWGAGWHQSVIDGGTLSRVSRMELQRRGCLKTYEADPFGVAGELEQAVLQDPDRPALLTLAELSLDLAGLTYDSDQRRLHLLAAAGYAYASLFDPDAGPAFSAFHPYQGLAVDLYNLAAAGFIQEQNNPDYRPAYAFRVRAFRERFVNDGLGVPLIRSLEPKVLLPEDGLRRPPVRRSVMHPATGLLHFNLPLHAPPRLEDVRVEILDPRDQVSTMIAGQRVPLEADWSAPLALALAEKPEWDSLLSQPRFLDGNFAADFRGLYLLQPYRAGRVPVVFVHGLIDTAFTWMPMLNGLLGDRDLAGRWQAWAYFYPTVTPIAHSAAELRASLADLREVLDPEHLDPALDRMVIIGHSLGGILTRMMISGSDGAFAESSAARAEQKGMPEDAAQAYVRHVGTFEPLDSVQRAVIIAAPMKGARMAQTLPGRLSSLLISQPDYVRKGFTRAGVQAGTVDSLPNGIDNLQPESRFIRILGQLEPAADIPVHTIIATGSGKPEGGDGLVSYESAHLPDAESELLLKSNHLQVHRSPAAIREVRRILSEHCGLKAEPPPPAP